MPSFKPLFSVGFPLHFDHDCLLDDSVRNCIAKDRIRKDFAPVFHGELGGDNGGEVLDPSVHEVVYILKLLGSQGTKSKIVDDKATDPRQLLEKTQVSALGPGEGDLLEKAVEGEEEGRKALPTGRLS